MSSSLVLIADLVDSKKLAATPGGRTAVGRACEELRSTLSVFLKRPGVTVTERESRGDNVEWRMVSESSALLADVGIYAAARTLISSEIGKRFRYSLFSVDSGVSYHPRYGAFEALFKEPANRPFRIAVDQGLTSVLEPSMATWVAEATPRTVDVTFEGEPILGARVNLFALDTEIERLRLPPNRPSSSANQQTTIPALKKSQSGPTEKSRLLKPIEGLPLRTPIALRFADGFTARTTVRAIGKRIASLAKEHGENVEIGCDLPLSLAATVLRVSESDKQIVRLVSDRIAVHRPRRTHRYKRGIGVSCDPDAIEARVDTINLHFRDYKDKLTDRGIVWVTPGSPARMLFHLVGASNPSLIGRIFAQAESAVLTKLLKLLVAPAKL